MSSDMSTLVLKVQVSFSSAGALGSSNFVFSYNDAEVNSPSLISAANFDAGTNASYGVMSVTQPTSNTASINFELQSSNSGTSVTMGATWTDVATLAFTLPDDVGTAGFQWLESTTTQTIAYAEDNSSLLTSGLLENNDMSVTSTALPVDLAYFRAYPEERTVLLDWATISETNNYFFEIQRSDDGVVWHVLDSVSGFGTTTKYQVYYWYDEPVEGSRYYRLRQVDYDGAFEYSDIVYVALLFDHPEVKVFPNPFERDVQFRISGLQPYQQLEYRLVSIAGEDLLNGTVVADSNGNLTQFIRPLFTLGLCFLLIEGRDMSVRRRLVSSPTTSAMIR